jgi:hypothetical protein
MFAKTHSKTAFQKGLESDFQVKFFHDFGFVEGFHFVEADPPGEKPADAAVDIPAIADMPDDEFEAFIEKMPEQIAGESVSGLKSALVKEREERKRQEQLVRQYEQYGDPEAIKQLKAKIENQEKFENEVRAASSAKLAELKQSYEPIIKAERDAREAAERKFNELHKKSAVERWYNRKEVSGLPSEFENFYALTKDRFNFNPETGGFEEVYDADGKVIYVDGKVADPSELMLKIRKGEEGYSLAGCFQPFNKSSGGGMPSTGSAGNRGQEWKTLNTTDKYSAGFANQRR